MANNNVQNVRFLRNGTLSTTRDEALTKLNAQPLAAEQDGSIILARYGSGDAVKTLVGLVYANGVNKSLTIFDIEGASGDVETLRTEINNKLGTGITSDNTATAQLAALSGNAESTSAETSVKGAKRYADGLIDGLDYTGVTTGTGVYVTNVTEANGIVSATTATLPDASSVSGASKVVIDVTQTKGQVTTTAANLTGVKLDGYAEAAATGDVAASDTLGQALGKLQKTIHEMDKAATAVDGQVVTTVSETDGKVTETKANVKDLQLGGYTKEAAATGDIASADTINTALSKLENKAAAITIANDDKSINVTTSTTGTNINVNIKSGEKVIKKDGNGGLYTNIAISAVTGTELSDLGTTVKEAYKLVGTDSTKLGEYIKIYKDSSISKIYLGYSDDTVDENSGVITSGTTGDPQSLNYVYHKEDGKYEMVHVDVSKFLVESEFASGVTADATGVVHGVVDPTSETNSGGTAFLTVGADGFKVSGIKQEIIDRINELDASVIGGTTAGTATADHVQVVVDEVDGKLTAVTVNEANIADADDLAALSAKTVTEVASSNSSITATKSQATDGTSKYDIITDASKIQMSGFTSTDVLSGINSTSSVTEAFKEVDKVITDNERVVSAALNDLEATKVENITVNGVNGTFSDKIASVTIDGADIKLDGYASGSSSAAVVATDTVNEAIGKLENQVKANAEQNKVVAGNGIVVGTPTSTGTSVSVKIDNTTYSGQNALVADANGLRITSIDCGTY